MKLTTKQLKQIIKEELQILKMMRAGRFSTTAGRDIKRPNLEDLNDCIRRRN